MSLLLVENDEKMARFIKEGLTQFGFDVDHCLNGKEGLQMLLRKDYDLSIVDIMLPVLDGLSMIEEMRNSKNYIPVLILSAKADISDRVNGLNRGADDYLTKPFAFSELLARVQALIRRAKTFSNPSRLYMADLTLDLKSRKVIRAGKQIDLQPLEFSLLEYLLQNAGQVVSKSMIMDNVWDYNFSPGVNVVESKICYLRDKIDRDFESKLIHTIRGVGYMIKDGV